MALPKLWRDSLIEENERLFRNRNTLRFLAIGSARISCSLSGNRIFAGYVVKDLPNKLRIHICY